MKKTANKIFVLIFSVVCVALSVVIASLLSSAITVSGGATITNSFSDFKIYCISLGEYTSSSQATSKVEESLKKGGGGFVFKDDNIYHVLASAYEKENDAKLVQQNLAESGISSKIIIIEISKPQLKDVSSEQQKKSFLQALSQLKTTYVMLYDISVSLDTEAFDETKAKIEIIAVKGNLESMLEKTNKGETSVDGIYYQMIKNTYSQTETILENLKNYENIDGITLSAKIKNAYLNIINQLDNLIDLLNNNI